MTGNDDESHSTTHNNVYAKEKRDTKNEGFSHSTMFMRKNGKRKKGICYNNILSLKIYWFIILLISSLGFAAMPVYDFHPSPEYQQAGRGKGRSMDGRDSRSRYRR